MCRSGQCYRDLRFDSVMGLLTGFWKLSHAEQDSFLFTCFASAEDRGSAESAVSDNAAPVRHQYNVMGQHLRVDCFVHLLGIHKRRIYNGLAGKPDGRTFNVHREAPKKASIVFFLVGVVAAWSDYPRRPRKERGQVARQILPWDEAQRVRRVR